VGRLKAFQTAEYQVRVFPANLRDFQIEIHNQDKCTYFSPQKLFTFKKEKKPPFDKVKGGIF
jgi:hypothetical protein